MTVVPEADRTTIRIVRNVRDRALVALAAALVSGTVALPLVVTVLLDGFGWIEDAAVMTGVGSALFLALKTGRGLFRRGHARAAERVQVLTERLATKVRESINDG